jgi:hypothetical protein
MLYALRAELPGSDKYFGCVQLVDILCKVVDAQLMQKTTNPEGKPQQSYNTEANTSFKEIHTCRTA